MGGYAATAIAALKVLQVVLASLHAYLGMTSYLCPVSSSIDTVRKSACTRLSAVAQLSRTSSSGKILPPHLFLPPSSNVSIAVFRFEECGCRNNRHMRLFKYMFQVSNGPYKYIIVGAGEAGMVLANRLGETDADVLILEPGGCPPMESLMAGYFTMIPRTDYDYAYDAHDDGYSCQNLKLEGLITAGKMLGGSSALNHLIYVTPKKEDYFSWGKAAMDDSWDYPKFSDYFAKAENVQHKGVLAQNTSIHGTDGPAKLTKQESSSNADVIAAFVEMGLPYKNDTDGQCVMEPLLYIADGIRQSSIVGSNVLGKKNLRFLTGATVTKIIIEDNTATGVEFSYNGNSYSLGATSKVIVSAGAIKSPQLLMLSGIGDRDKLSSFGIKVVVDNKHVGQNLMDHTVTSMVIALDKNTEPAPAANPTQWPSSMVTSYAGLTPEEESYSRQDIVLRFPPNSTGLLQLSSYVFQYKDEICDAWYEYNINRNIMFEIMNLMRPKSRGSIELQSANITVQPIINMNHLSDSADLDLLAKHAMSFAKILDTEPMKKLNAEFADVGVCADYEKFSLEFWKCYVLATSSTLWHYCGTCAMGTVLDGNLNVIGVKNLKVIDASSFHSIVSSNIAFTVRALAEKGADIIKKEDGLVNV